MAHSRSAKKRVRQNLQHRAANRWRKGRIRDAVKDFLATIHQGNVEQAQTKLAGLYKLVDQIASKGTIHKNAAARYKGRLTARLNKLKAGPAKAA